MRNHSLILLLIVAFTASACSTLPKADADMQPPPSGAIDGAWRIQFDNQPAMAIDYDYGRVVDAGFTHWGKDWGWAETRYESRADKKGGYQFRGRVEKLGLGFQGTIKPQGDGRFVAEYEFDAAHAMKDVIGGGLVFMLKTDSPALVGRGDPELLKDQRGWRWKLDDDQELRFEFDPPMAEVYKERGDNRQIRAFFFSKAIKAGKHRWKLNITLPKGARQAPSLGERYGNADLADWLPGALGTQVSPVDLSSMNHKPAGKHGFIEAKGQHLQFADGTPARFWGANVQAYSIFSDRLAIKRHAKRLAQLGFNLVRLHHHDSMSWVKPSVIHHDKKDSQQLNGDSLALYDWWVKCLKDEGIYVWIDLHTGRNFKPGDRIPGFEELAREGNEAKGFCYYNERVEALMKKFNEDFLTRKNVFTGIAYKDEPAVVALLITNENDITDHFGHRMLPDKKNPFHGVIFQTRVREFCRATGLPYDRTWRTWEDGPSKLFLNNEERKFHERVKKHLRSIGVRVPIATTNTWGNMPSYSLPALTVGDLLDVHTYGRAEFLSRNPRYEPNFINWIAAGQVVDMPLSVTEWNVEYPNVDRFAAPTYVASIASLQGWDAMMLYGYAQGPLGERPTSVGQWSAYPDTALMGAMPAAAAIFRQGHVAQAKNEFRFAPEGEKICTNGFSPRNSAAIRTLSERSRLTMAMPKSKYLPWLKPSPASESATNVTDVHRDFVPAGKQFIESDTGELRRDWVRGVQTVDTPKSQVAAGWLKGGEIKLANVEMIIDTPKAVVALSSLDNKPLADSKRILLTAVARAEMRGDRLPFYSERVRGKITFKSNRSNLSLIPLASSGVEMEPVELDRKNGLYTIELPAVRGSHWYYLTSE